MMDENSLAWKLKVFVWSVSAGTVISFFFSANYLAWATSFNPGESFLLVSPIMCGLLLGIIMWETDALQTVIATFILTITAVAGVILTQTAPIILGVTWVPDTYYIFVAQNIMITIILVLPLSLLGAMVGRFFAENTIMSPHFKFEREQLRSDTVEWYEMLERKLEEKKAALEELRAQEERMSESPEDD